LEKALLGTDCRSGRFGHQTKPLPRPCIEVNIRMLGRVSLAVALSGSLSAQIAAVLTERTQSAFDSYVQTAERNMDWQPALEPKVGMVQVSTWGGKASMAVDRGLIHDWVAGVEVPGASVKQALAMFQDYADYPKIFAPEVTEANVLSQSGNFWDVHLRLQRKNVVTVVLDTEYEIEYRPLENGQWAIISRSTRISEVDKGETLPPGTGNGYLWGLNTYWLLVPRPGGLYMECRTISLSRDIPTGLGWLIKPMVHSASRDSLREMVEEARRGLNSLRG
jgi:hypothetical protein